MQKINRENLYSYLVNSGWKEISSDDTEYRVFEKEESDEVRSVEIPVESAFLYADGEDMREVLVNCISNPEIDLEQYNLIAEDDDPLVSINFLAPWQIDSAIAEEEKTSLLLLSFYVGRYAEFSDISYAESLNRLGITGWNLVKKLKEKWLQWKGNNNNINTESVKFPDEKTEYYRELTEDMARLNYEEFFSGDSNKKLLRSWARKHFYPFAADDDLCVGDAYVLKRYDGSFYCFPQGKDEFGYKCLLVKENCVCVDSINPHPIHVAKVDKDKAIAFARRQLKVLSLNVAELVSAAAGE